MSGAGRHPPALPRGDGTRGGTACACGRRHRLRRRRDPGVSRRLARAWQSSRPSIVVVRKARVTACKASGQATSNLRRFVHACHGHGQGVAGLRSRRHARRRAARRDGQIQRGTGQGGRDAGRRGPAPQPQGRARALFGQPAQRRRRAFRRDPGAGGRVLALAGALDGRGHRVGAALPEPARGGLRGRDPPRLRGRRLR